MVSRQMYRSTGDAYFYYAPYPTGYIQGSVFPQILFCILIYDSDFSHCSFCLRLFMLNSNYIDINNKKAQTPSVLLSTTHKVYISTWWRVSGHFSLPYLLHSYRNRIACTFVRVVPWHLHKRQKRSLALFGTFSTLIFVFSSSTIFMRIARVQKTSILWLDLCVSI